MNFPLPDTSRVKVTSGKYAAENLATLANRHPFTQKLEVLFPENAKLETALAQLKTRYAKSVFKLSEIAENGDAFIQSLEAQSKFLMLSIEKNSDDMWCIDSRGILTLFLSKETYQKLGIVGRTLPFKQASGERVVQFSLRKNTDTPGNVARRFAALRAWEKRREEETGFSGWHVVYCSRDPDTVTHPLAADKGINQMEIRHAACSIRKIRDVNIPDVNLHPFPEGKGNDAEERAEDWNDDVHALFEYVGMACLRSQRLKLNDRTDPYVALYEPPPSRPGNLTHMEWQGFLSPGFVQLINDTVISFLNTLQMAQDDLPFVSVTSHSVTRTALSYISPKNTSVIPSSAEALRLPREDGEDTWCLYATRSRPNKGDAEVDWLLAESVDKCDTRWG